MPDPPTAFYDPDQVAFGELARRFIATAVRPHLQRWDEQGLVDREVWTAAGHLGLLGIGLSEAVGGGGQPGWRFRCAFMDELAAAFATCVQTQFSLNEDIAAPYIADLADPAFGGQWLAGMASGEVIAAVAMTEPAAGSDLRGIRTQARRDGPDWVISGSKTFITNATRADAVVVFARTGDDHFGLFLVEGTAAGLTRGRAFAKVGQHGQDTGELFFDNVRVPAQAVLGDPARGLRYLVERLPRERMSIAWYACSLGMAALAATVEFCSQRPMFGSRLIDMQNTRFALAEMSTELDVTRAYLERLVGDLDAGELTVVAAAKAKWWATETCKQVIDRCVQLHGGTGYMLEHLIGRAYVDARVQTIYGGTTEVMKEVIGRDLASSDSGRRGGRAGPGMPDQRARRRLGLERS